MAKIQPSVLTLNYSGDGFIDLAQGLSLVNRRFYRQGMQYAAAGFTVQFSGAAAGNVRIETLPTTWVCSNAWHKAFAVWKKQQDEAMADSGSESAVAKFRDFKIFMDTVHVDAGAAANLLPTYGDGSANFSPGEWDMSQVVFPNTDDTDPSTGPQLDAAGNPIDIHPTEAYLHMVGVNNNGGVSRGIIAGYASSRSYPQSPDPVEPGVEGTDNWMNRMFNVGNDNPIVVQNAVDHNDDLPYPQVDYPGGDTQAPGLQLHSAHAISSTTISNRFTIPGCVIPCGLLKFTNDTGVNAQLQIHLVPGKYRGYLAEPMQDM